MTDVTPLVQAVFIVVATIITLFAVPFIKSKTTVEQQKEINEWIKIAVSAAEQIYKGVGRGKEKKNYVLTWLETHGIDLDESKLDAWIESAVYKLNNGLITIDAIGEDENNA